MIPQTLTEMSGIAIAAVLLLFGLGILALKHLATKILKNTEDSVTKTQLETVMKGYVTAVELENIHLKQKIALDAELSKTRHDLNNAMNGMSGNIQVKLETQGAKLNELGLVLARVEGHISGVLEERKRKELTES